MPVKTEESPAIPVPGNLTSSTLTTFYTELDNQLKESPNEIVLDCSRLDHATSNHISLLWETLQRSKQAGIPMRLLSVRYGLKRVLEILDLYDLFEISTEGSTALQLKIRLTSDDIDQAIGSGRNLCIRFGNCVLRGDNEHSSSRSIKSRRFNRIHCHSQPRKNRHAIR